MSFVVFILRKYLRPRMEANFTSFATISSISGIAIGVMALIVVVSIMTGFELDLKSQMLKFKPHLIIKKSKGGLLNYDDVIQKIKIIPGIKEAEAFVSTQAIISNKNITVGTTIRGIRDYDDNTHNPMGRKFIFLKNNLLSTKSSIVLNTGLMQALGLNLGEYVYVILPEGNLSPVGHIPRIKKFQVIGVIDHNNFDLPGGYISIDEAQKMLKLGESVSGIEIRAVRSTNMGSIISTILSRLKMKNVINSIEIESWEETNNNLLSAMKLERIVMFIILFFIVLISTFSITASLAISTHSKRKEINILKTMGATSTSIYQIFIFKGFLIGFLGTLIGTFCGIVTTKFINKFPISDFFGKVYFNTTLPINLEVGNVVLVVLSASFMSFVAAIYPAYKVASRERIYSTNC